MEEIKVEGIKVEGIKYTMTDRFVSCCCLSCHDQSFKARSVCSVLLLILK